MQQQVAGLPCPHVAMLLLHPQLQQGPLQGTARSTCQQGHLLHSHLPKLHLQSLHLPCPHLCSMHSWLGCKAYKACSLPRPWHMGRLQLLGLQTRPPMDELPSRRQSCSCVSLTTERSNLPDLQIYLVRERWYG